MATTNNVEPSRKITAVPMFNPAIVAGISSATTPRLTQRFGRITRLVLRLSEAAGGLRARCKRQLAYSCQRKTIAIVVNTELRWASTVSRDDMRFGEPFAGAQQTDERSRAAITRIRHFWEQ